MKSVQHKKPVPPNVREVRIACVQNWRTRTKLTHFFRRSEGGKRIDYVQGDGGKCLFIPKAARTHSAGGLIYVSLLVRPFHSQWLFIRALPARLQQHYGAGRAGEYSDVDKFCPTLAAFVVVTWRIDLWCVCVRKRGLALSHIYTHAYTQSLCVYARRRILKLLEHYFWHGL